MIKSLANWLWKSKKKWIKRNFSVIDFIQWIHLWIHWWFSQKIQIIKMSDILRKFVNILNESVDKFNWICEWIKMNSLMNLLMNSNEFVDEFKWICWWILMYLLMNSNEFIDEFKWTHWWIQNNLLMNYWWILVNSLRNPSAFIEET